MVQLFSRKLILIIAGRSSGSSTSRPSRFFRTGTPGRKQWRKYQEAMTSNCQAAAARYVVPTGSLVVPIGYSVCFYLQQIGGRNYSSGDCSGLSSQTWAEHRIPF